MNSRRSLINILSLIGQPILLNIISVPAMAYIIFRLGPLRFGQWTIGASLVATTAFLANLGLRTLFVRSVSQNPDNAAETLGEQLGLRGLLSLVAGLAAIILCMVLRYQPVVLTCVTVNVVALTLYTVSSSFSDLLQSFQNFKAIAAVNLAAGLALTAVSVGAVVYGAGPVLLSLTYLVGPLVSLILFAIIVRRQLPIRVYGSIERYRELLKQVREMGTQLFVVTIQERIEQLLVPKLVGVAEFGYFSAGSMPASRLSIVPDGLATAYFPGIAHDCDADRSNVYLLVTQLFVISTVICVPLAVLLTFLAQPIAQILFPKHSEICKSIIEISIWTVPLQAIFLPLGFSLQAAGKHREVARISSAATVCGLGLSLLLVGRFHLIGACWSLLARPAIGALVLIPTFARTFPEVPARIPLIRIGLCALLMAVVLWCSTSLHMGLWLTIAGGSSLAIAGYACSLLGLGIIKVAEVRQILMRRPAQ